MRLNMKYAIQPLLDELDKFMEEKVLPDPNFFHLDTDIMIEGWDILLRIHEANSDER